MQTNKIILFFINLLILCLSSQSPFIPPASANGMEVKFKVFLNNYSEEYRKMLFITNFPWQLSAVISFPQTQIKIKSITDLYDSLEMTELLVHILLLPRTNDEEMSWSHSYQYWLDSIIYPKISIFESLEYTRSIDMNTTRFVEKTLFYCSKDDINEYVINLEEQCKKTTKDSEILSLLSLSVGILIISILVVILILVLKNFNTCKNNEKTNKDSTNSNNKNSKPTENSPLLINNGNINNDFSTDYNYEVEML